MIPLPTSPQTLRRRLLRTIVTGIMTKSSRSSFQEPTAWDTIDLVIHVRIVITRITQTSIVAGNGKVARPIKTSRREALQARRLSSEEDIEPMAQLHRGLHQEYLLRLLRIVAMIRRTMQGDDATTIDEIVVAIVVFGETARVGARSILLTQVRPVSLVASLI